MFPTKYLQLFQNFSKFFFSVFFYPAKTICCIMFKLTDRSGCLEA